LRSIRSQLLGLVVATVVPFTALIGTGLWSQWRTDQAAAIQRACDEARLIVAQVDDHIGNLTNLLIGLSQAVSTGTADVAANDALLRRVKADLPAFVGNIAVFSLDGTNIGTSSQAGRFYAGDRRYFREVLAGQRLAIGDVVKARALREWVVTLARPITDKAGKLRGVVTVGTVLEHFQDAPRVKDLPRGSVVCIINQHGEIIARSVDGAKWIGRNIGNWPSVARHLAAQEGSDVVTWPDGVE